MKRRCVLEEAVGETRAAIYEGRKLVEFHLWRWSDADVPRLGQSFNASISKVDKSIGGAFIKLGENIEGFLRFSNTTKMPRLHEGQLIDVCVTKEAMGGKGPVLKYLPNGCDADAASSDKKSLESQIRQLYPGIEFQNANISSLDEAVETSLSLKGGGDVCFEQTRALLAIDIDKGRAPKTLDVCLEACDVIAQQLRLRGLGGLVVIDFPNLRQPKQRDSVYERLNLAFENDPATVKIAPMSRFGTIELTRSKLTRALDEILNDEFGSPTIETLAIRALRNLEREGRSSPGARLTLRIPEPVQAWLENDKIGWREVMVNRIGERFSLELGDKVDVVADR